MDMNISFVGLDVGKATIAVYIADDGRQGGVRFVSGIENSPAALNKLIGSLGRNGRDLHFVYEAGPCGYGVFRHLTARELNYVVVAPRGQSSYEDQATRIPSRLGALLQSRIR
ncbi:hypothetical protein [Beijerinckia mobilis]|uniref:hypothetical protein n=1 Tax=Beijerinckia mobilis TaxID=231434 RepID=UPI000690730A|nr:hypothetical protein [Beijerinckia mobilis]